MNYILFLLSLFLASLSLQVDAQCKDGELRLDISFLEGPVEFCSMNKWGNVCGSQWDDKDATVVCRELGFSDKDSLEITYDTVREITLGRVRCSGKEKRLRDCRSSAGPCVGIAGVRCRYDGPPLLAFNTTILLNNSIIDLERITITETIVNSIACITDQFPCCNGKDNWIIPVGTDMNIHRNFLSLQYHQSMFLYRNGDVHVPNGIFSCQISDSSNSTHIFYVGIYLQGLGKPTITTFTFDRPARMLTCSSIGGPVTNITWSKDGDELTGSNYIQSQLIVDTGLAIYKNTLTITQSALNVSGTYTCTVSNSRGKSSSTVSVPTCDNGDVMLEQETGSRNVQSKSQNGNNNNAAAILGAFFGISIVAIVVIILVFVVILWYLHSHSHLQLNHNLTSRSNLEELQNMEHEVSNDIYGVEDKDESEDAITSSMEYNRAYLSSGNDGPSNEAPNNHYECCRTDSVSTNVYSNPDSA